MKTIGLFCIILASLSLAAGYAPAALPLTAVSVIAAGWLAGYRFGWRWAAPAGLAAVVAMAGYGVWQGMFAGWALVGVTAALLAWDLDRFSYRLTAANTVYNRPGLVQAHLQRLGVVAGLGLGIGAVGLTFHLELSLGWAILLGLGVVVGLGRLITAAR